MALSHAAILEESTRARSQLIDQNVALDQARREAETAIHACNDFLTLMNNEMSTPRNAIISLASLLLETELTSEQRIVIETVLKTSNLLETLINDVLDMSKVEDGTFMLDSKTFNLHNVVREVMDLIEPIASVKKLKLTSTLAMDLPLYAVGDNKRLMQIILNITANAVKFTKTGRVSVTATVVNTDTVREWHVSEFSPTHSDGFFYLMIQVNKFRYHFFSLHFIQSRFLPITIQVEDSGCGVSPQNIPHIFRNFALNRSQDSARAGLGLPISKRYNLRFHIFS